MQQVVREVHPRLSSMFEGTSVVLSRSMGCSEVEPNESPIRPVLERSAPRVVLEMVGILHTTRQFLADAFHPVLRVNRSSLCASVCQVSVRASFSPFPLVSVFL